MNKNFCPSFPPSSAPSFEEKLPPSFSPSSKREPSPPSSTSLLSHPTAPRTFVQSKIWKYTLQSKIQSQKIDQIVKVTHLSWVYNEAGSQMWSKKIVCSKHLGKWKLEAGSNASQCQVGCHHCPEWVSENAISELWWCYKWEGWDWISPLGGWC